MDLLTAYKTILREGRREGSNEGLIAGTRGFFLIVCTRRFSKPDPATIARLEAIQDFDHLEVLFDRLFDSQVKTWDDFLRQP